ncbi:chromate efflux transporter [Ramlibacter sp. AW1]|uniref:Chromate efflux transporter n=1 Tax=Ramlibacter aurantiacus TaxID=2801330 RepID=A0A936ZUA4_9BURK|nr:chromate efflux transporter [Ramlibacter aurantiacus]MBL0420734.1 chromate efflux transporter [Ramlibacter aurantiacus]
MTRPSSPPAPQPLQVQGRPLEVLAAFLKLGLTSFGGPVAHLGYFHAEFVQRRRWLDERSYADLVALCQFLPGPASSQVGIALGLQRAGWRGALLAWLGFTLPSALALIAFAYGIATYGQLAESGAVHGLKVVAVAVVAQAVWGMARSLCPDRPRAGLAIGAALLTLVLPSAIGQVGAIVASGLVGWWMLQLPHPNPVPHVGWGVSRRAGIAALGVFALLLLGLPLVVLATGSTVWALVEGFYRAGALVFGGGHVVLPLLQSAVVPVGAVGNSEFLAGYGAAQAVPGPLFTFAAYLGAVMKGPLSGWTGGGVFVLVIFVPAFLLVVGALPFWDSLRQRDAVRSAMAGVNAGVVGILLSALYDPVWTSAILRPADFGLALAAFGLLVVARVSPVWVVMLGAGAGWLLA